MKKIFLNPIKPLHTCNTNSCEGCEVTDKLVCHFNGKQLSGFMLLTLPVFFTAGYIIFTQNPFLLILWIIFVISFLELIEIRVMCSHCPHYAEPEIKSLKCWANYGAPKLWKYRPGPMSIIEKTIFILGFLIIFLPSIFILMFQKNYLLLLIYVVLLVALKIALGTFYCKRCINFACPFNVVGNSVRDKFFNKNVLIKKAWKK